ncbi:MAG: dihydropteroate synthase [Dehalococcoidia bacterium]
MRIGSKLFEWGSRTFIMGVVNATPDSFSGDGVVDDPGNIQRAVDQALRMEDQGADIIDIGGESTRPVSVYPDAKPVSEDKEKNRVIPLIDALIGRLEVPISIDTRKAGIVRAAVRAGASLANDVSLLGDPEMAETVSELQTPIVLSHIREGGHGSGVVNDVLSDLDGAIQLLETAGLSRIRIICDPGIGFAKKPDQSLSVLRGTSRLRDELETPILIGTSRKSFIGAVTDKPVDKRIFGTAASIAWTIGQGADIVRVHDVAEMIDVVKLADALQRGWDG